MPATPTTAWFRLIDAEGNTLGKRSTLGAARNLARFSNAGKRAVAIVAPDGATLSVVRPTPAR